MHRTTTSALAAVLLLLSVPACGDPEIDADLAPWIAKARTMLDDSSRQLAARWGRPLSPDWGRNPDVDETVFLDFDNAKVFWLKDKKTALVADVQFVGSYEFDPKAPKDKPEEAGSWRWSWDGFHANVPDKTKQRIFAVRRWGDARRSVKFTKGGWIGPVEWAFDMLASSVRILGASGGYFKNFGDRGFFFVIEEVRKPKPDEIAPDLSKATTGK